MVRATALRMGVCAGLVCCDRVFFPASTSRWAGRWRCLLDHLPHMGGLTWPVHVHVPAPPGEYRHLCRPRLSHSFGDDGFVARSVTAHPSLRFRPGSQLSKGCCRRWCGGPSEEAQSSRHSGSGYVMWIFLMVGSSCCCGPPDEADGLGAHSRRHRGVPSPALVLHRDVCTPSRRGCNGLRPGGDGLCPSQSVGSAGVLVVAGHPDSAVRPARRHPPLRCCSCFSEIALYRGERCRQCLSRAAAGADLGERHPADFRSVPGPQEASAGPWPGRPTYGRAQPFPGVPSAPAGHGSWRWHGSWCGGWGIRPLQPAVLIALVALSLSFRLVFEDNVFSYYYMALAVTLVLLDVVGGRIRRRSWPGWPW